MAPYFDRIAPEELSGEALDLLLSLGWYRMHQSLFTCSHVEMGELHRVHWLRFRVGDIQTSATHRRIVNKNRAFHVRLNDFDGISDEQATLHARYRAAINFDGALSISECLFGEEATSQNNIFNTKCISILDGDQLIAAGYFDIGQNTVASILHFFDPDYARFSLGKYLILITLDYLRNEGIDWYYPGYVVEGLSKMNYKLFIGRDEAQYFVPENTSWHYFHEGILNANDTP